MNFIELEENSNKLLDKYSEISICKITPPVPIEKLAEDLFSVKIEKDRMESGIAGKLYVKDKVIVLNVKDILERQRFTIAHEVGHLFLHEKNSKVKSIVCRKNDNSRIEKEANCFAAYILMPKRLIYDQVIMNSQEMIDLKWISGILKHLSDTRLHSINKLIFNYTKTSGIINQNENIRKEEILIKLISIISKQFLVSKEAITWRFKNLGLLDGFLEPEVRDAVRKNIQ